MTTFQQSNSLNNSIILQPLHSIEKSSTTRLKPHEKLPNLKIPLISKKLNSIEKYINELNYKTQEVAKTKRENTTNRIKYQPSTSRDTLHHYRSVQVKDFLQEGDIKKSKDECCVKYDSLLNNRSEERIQKLSRLQKDYSLLKEKIHPHRKFYTGEQLMSIKSSRGVGKEDHIAEEDVQREIKHLIIKQNGKNYFADLYMLKKSRENILSSLSNVGKHTLGSGGSSPIEQLSSRMNYQQKLKANQQQFVRSKISHDRQEKRTKMIKGRNLHWNVYYDMLALSPTEKNKMKKLCKFPSTFGIA